MGKGSAFIIGVGGQAREQGRLGAVTKLLGVAQTLSSSLEMSAVEGRGCWQVLKFKWAVFT